MKQTPRVTLQNGEASDRDGGVESARTWTLASGETVIDRDPSHIHPGVTEELLGEAMTQCRMSAPGKEREKWTFDFERDVGFNNCVDVGPDDEVVYAQRPDRLGLSKFVKNKQRSASSKMTFSVRKQQDGTYQLRTAYIGEAGAVEPWAALYRNSDDYGRATSYWSTHALAWGSEEIVAGTETLERPWSETLLVFGSGRFADTVRNNRNDTVVAAYDIPTKLVDTQKNVMLCLPEDAGTWGNYPTHQDSWLSLNVVTACHSMHTDKEGLAKRKEAWANIQPHEFAALIAKANEFNKEFLDRLSDPNLTPRKAFKSATRALQDCLLYISDVFPEHQDAFLKGSPFAHLIDEANKGRRGELNADEGRKLHRQIQTRIDQCAEQFGGIEACRDGLQKVEESGKEKNGRVILLPETMTLESAAELVRGDIVIGTPDSHDMDIVSIVSGQNQPKLVQLTDQLSKQRLDIMAVSADLLPNDHLTGGHPAFQSVAEMMLANGTARTVQGEKLIARLRDTVDPRALAKKYRDVAKKMLLDPEDHKGWTYRKDNERYTQVKKVIPLYRIACDLLPRALYMESTGHFTGGVEPIELAESAGLGEIFKKIRHYMDPAVQDAPQEELEEIAKVLADKLQNYA
jgi:hypothetical protein